MYIVNTRARRARGQVRLRVPVNANNESRTPKNSLLCTYVFVFSSLALAKNRRFENRGKEYMILFHPRVPSIDLPAELFIANPSGAGLRVRS